MKNNVVKWLNLLTHHCIGFHVYQKCCRARQESAAVNWNAEMPISAASTGTCEASQTNWNKGDLKVAADTFCSRVAVLFLSFTNTHFDEEVPSHSQGSQRVLLCVVAAEQCPNPHNSPRATVMGSSKLKRHSSHLSRKSTPNTLEETYLRCVVVWRGECVLMVTIKVIQQHLFSVSEQLPGRRRESRAG